MLLEAFDALTERLLSDLFDLEVVFELFDFLEDFNDGLSESAESLDAFREALLSDLEDLVTTLLVVSLWSCRTL